MAEEKKWRALDHCSKDNDSTILQDGDQFILTKQKSKELIVVKDSEDITVQTTDAQAAIIAVLSITVGDTDRANHVAQDIFQLIETKQENTQKTIILNSKHVNVTTTDTDISVNIQALLQVLIAIIIRLDVL